MLIAYLPLCFAYAKLRESADGSKLIIYGDGSINHSAVHSYSYSKYTYIEIQNEITRIEDSTFSGCSSLLEITLPNYITFLGKSVFNACTSLLHVILPEGIKELYDDVFISCKNLRNITIPQTLEKISAKFLYKCPKFEKFFVNINNKNFSTRENNEILTNKNGTIAYRFKCFGLIKVPSCIEIFDTYCMYHETYSGIEFEQNSRLKIIRSRFISDTSGISTFVAPDSLERIEFEAFCRSYIVNITLNDNLQYLDPNAFSGSNTLQNVFVNPACKAVSIIDDIIYGPTGKELIFIPSKTSFLNITKDTSKISYSSIRTSPMLENVNVSDDNSLFWSYDGALYQKSTKDLIVSPFLKRSILIYSETKIIWGTAFKGTSIVNVTFEGNVLTNIQSEAFSGCASLERINIPTENFIEIGPCAMFQTEKLSTSFTFGSTFKTISYAAFYGSSITDIDLSKTAVTFINEECFKYCIKLKTVKLPSKIQEIHKSAFESTAISEIDIGSNVVTVGESAFMSCSNLKTINFDIKGVLETIDISAFAGCIISSVEIPSSVKNLNGKCFQNCKNLKTVIIHKNSTMEKIAADVFDGCDSITEIWLPKSINSSDGKRSIFRSRSESTIMNGTKNGTIVLNEKTERAVKAAFGAQNFFVNQKMRGESASESIFYNVKLKIIKHILSKRDSFLIH